MSMQSLLCGLTVPFINTLVAQGHIVCVMHLCSQSRRNYIQRRYFKLPLAAAHMAVWQRLTPAVALQEQARVLLGSIRGSTLQENVNVYQMFVL